MTRFLSAPAQGSEQPSGVRFLLPPGPRPASTTLLFTPHVATCRWCLLLLSFQIHPLPPFTQPFPPNLITRRCHPAAPLPVLQEADAGEVAFRRTADKLMGDLGTSGDAPFGGEVQVDADSQVYWWHEKYRPRRPKYFNRVHTG